MKSEKPKSGFGEKAGVGKTGGARLESDDTERLDLLLADRGGLLVVAVELNESAASLVDNVDWPNAHISTT